MVEIDGINTKLQAILDPRIAQVPPLKELKRVLLVALRCVDHIQETRPKMGEVLHILQPNDLLLSDVSIKISGFLFSRMPHTFMHDQSICNLNNAYFWDDFFQGKEIGRRSLSRESQVFSQIFSDYRVSDNDFGDEINHHSNNNTELAIVSIM